MGPVLILAVFFYFHRALQQLWEITSALPAVFPDGRPLHERAYPWVTATIIRSHFRRLRPGRGQLARVQNLGAHTLMWWGVPFTLAGFWWRYLVRHDLRMSATHAILAGISVCCRCCFRGSCG